MTKITNDATVHAGTDNTATSIQIGTIVYNTWGYEQTNVDFYEVVKSSRCFVWLQQLSADKTETLSMQGTTAPVPGTRAGKISKHKVSSFDRSRVAIKFEHGTGTIWDGEPKRFSSYA